MKPSTVSNALNVATDRFNMWQMQVAAVVAIAEDELRSGC